MTALGKFIETLYNDDGSKARSYFCYGFHNRRSIVIEDVKGRPKYVLEGCVVARNKMLRNYAPNNCADVEVHLPRSSLPDIKEKIYAIFEGCPNKEDILFVYE